MDLRRHPVGDFRNRWRTGGYGQTQRRDCALHGRHFLFSRDPGCRVSRKWRRARMVGNGGRAERCAEKPRVGQTTTEARGTLAVGQRGPHYRPIESFARIGLPSRRDVAVTDHRRIS